NPARVELAQGCEGLRDHRGVVTQSRTGHRRAHPDPLRLLPERTKRYPGLAAMALVGLPRLEMVAGSQQIEAGTLRCRAEPEQLRNRELLVCQHEAEHPLAQGSGATE